MDFQDCIKFASQNRTVFIATADGDQPRVRPLALQFADERGFYFQTENVKNIPRQLSANKKIEMCFHSTQGGGLGTVMRVTGEAQLVTDLKLKAKLLEERPFYKTLGIKAPDDPLFVLFRVYKGEAFFWTFANNMKESAIERIRFNCK